jgi:NitT/TauT family transport system substrate-binding protein
VASCAGSERSPRSCTDTYTAGIIVKERHLLAKHLPHAGKYAGMQYRIGWNDYSSGGPITNQMLAGKIDFGVMGDYPLIVNSALPGDA